MKSLQQQNISDFRVLSKLKIDSFGFFIYFWSVLVEEIIRAKALGPNKFSRLHETVRKGVVRTDPDILS
jgi:hypothetical protein